MYEFKRDIKEVPIKINGESIKLKINPSIIIDDVNRTYNDILRLQENMTNEEDREKQHEEFGELILKLISLIFRDHAEKYVKYYEGCYTEMAIHLIKFVELKVLPILEEFKKEQTSVLKEEYLNNKRKKRKNK